MEESSLAGWIAGILRPFVTKLIVCDPRHNALISRSNKKDDFTDALKLARLLRLDELLPVYHTDQDHRMDFKIAVQQYLSFVHGHAKLKSQLKAKYQQAGVLNVTGTEVFTKKHRETYLKRLPSNGRRANKVSHTPPPVRKMCETLQGASRLCRLTMRSVIGYPYICAMLDLLECGSTKRKSAYSIAILVYESPKCGP